MSGGAAVVDPPHPDLAPLARFRVRIAPAQEFGATHLGRRRVVNVVGGGFAGPRLSGEILPGGADWQLVHPDGLTTIDTRYTLRTDDGALVYLTTTGVRHEAGPGAGQYFRMTCRFETGDDRYGWLVRSVVVGSGVRDGDLVVYDAFVVT